MKCRSDQLFLSLNIPGGGMPVQANATACLKPNRRMPK